MTKKKEERKKEERKKKKERRKKERKEEKRRKKKSDTPKIKVDKILSNSDSALSTKSGGAPASRASQHRVRFNIREKSS